MTATLMDGVAVADAALSDTRRHANEFERYSGRKPCLATVLVGDDPASHTYVRMKTNRCATTGLQSRNHRLPDAVHTSEAVELVTKLSDDADVDGILVQHPLPAHIDERAVVIDAGYNSGNVGDVEYEATTARARLITPVPGGDGPNTIAVLLEQTVIAARSLT